MKIALAAARKAGGRDEVPIGACVVDGADEIVSVAGNRTIRDLDPTAHAEILAIREAALKVGNYRLTECAVYTTIEPCVMCAGALINARVSRLIYGAPDRRFGAVETLFEIGRDTRLNHRFEVTSGVLHDDCSELVTEFFAGKRSLSG